MNVMGIDIGTTSISMVLVDTKTGELTARRTVNHESFLMGMYPEEKIQDAKRIWTFVKQNMEELSNAYGQPVGIGLTGQMHGMLYVDRNGGVVSPLYTWQDGSGNKPLDKEDGRSSVELLNSQVGAVSAGYGLATHYYLQRTGRIPEDAEKMTTISDYVAMKLCGRTKPVMGADMAASWGCFDLKKKEFRRDALEAVGVDISYLPEVRKIHSIAGETEEGVPVMVSVGDNQASVLGSVSSLSDTVLINVGTGSQVSFASDTYVSCAGSMELRPCTDDCYILAGSSLCGGRAYAMLEQFYREVSGNPEESHYQKMCEQAQEFIEEYGADAAWNVRTTFAGTRSNPDEKGGITGISVENFHPGAMTVGVITGILRELYEQYEKMCEITGRRAHKLVGSGNGLRQNPLMQRLAEEMFGMELAIPACREEAACCAALCAPFFP